MAWSSRFLRALEEPEKVVRLHLRTARLFTREAIGQPWAIASWDGAPDPAIIATRPTDSVGSYISPPTFAPRVGVWEVPIAGDITWLMQRITMGQVVELRIGFAGWDLADFETVAVGQVWGLNSGRGAEYVIQIRDIIGLLNSRLTIDYAKSRLFSSLDGAVTTLASGYTVGDSTLVLTDASGFDDPPGSNYSGVKVSPAGGDPFYLTYAGKSGNTLTGVSATATHGTTASNASASDAATQVFLNIGHPITVARRILVSTGTADFNGTQDDLAETHGYGIPLRYIDVQDMIAWERAFQPSSGSASVSWLSETSQSNGLSWLASQLLRSGCYLATRQGALTVRALPTSGLNIGVAAEITEDDISSVHRWEAWWGGQSVEYGGVTAVGPTGSYTFTEPVSTLPSDYAAVVDASDIIHPNESGWRVLLASRFANWYCRWPEFIEVTCAGWRLAALAAGDTIRLTMTGIPGRLPSTEGGYNRRIAVVGGVTPDWFSATVRLQLFILPSRSDGF